VGSLVAVVASFHAFAVTPDDQNENFTAQNVPRFAIYTEKRERVLDPADDKLMSERGELWRKQR
jgi:hypothetical protein